MVEKFYTNYLMKTLLLARPDHSTFLYEELKKNPEIDISYHTFSAFKKKSLLNYWKPSVKSVDKEVDISYSFSFFHKFLYFLSKQIVFDYYKTESQFSTYFFKNMIQKFTDEVNIVHYWPIYYHQFVRNFQHNNPKIKFIADVYAAHPDHARANLESAFDEFGLSIEKSHFVKSRDTDLASLENVENMLVPSEYVAESYRIYYPKTKIYIANFGLFNNPPKIVKQLKRGNLSPLKLIFVGKVSIEKGCPYLFEAMRKLPNTEFHLDVIGEIETNQINIFRPYLNLPNIRILGKLPNFKILEILPEYHVFVLPSLSDAYSLAVSEALAHKLPVIITENVGNKYDVRKFQTGEVCQIKSVDVLIKSILNLQNEEYRQYLRTNIDDFIADNQENSYPSKVLEIYNQLLQK